MIQGLPQQQRVYQGLAAHVFTLEAVDGVAADDKTCDVPVVEGDTGQVAALAEQERGLEDIGGLVVGHFVSPPWCAPLRKPAGCDRKRISSASRRGFCGARQLQSRQRMEVDGLFLLSDSHKKLKKFQSVFLICLTASNCI